MKSIDVNEIKVWEEEYEKDLSRVILKRALTSTELNQIALKQESKAFSTFMFSKEIKTLPVTNQKKTGRCWIFAGLNVLREIIAKENKLKDFELSQNYIAFYDKLEKINYFLESVDDFLESDKDDRTLQHLVRTGIQDGGQWDMFVALIDKYGIVPKNAMDETANSSSTKIMNQFINLKLREYVAKARDNKNKKEQFKQQTLKELYSFLISNFGNPPKTFDFEYVDKDNNYNLESNYTPKVFADKYIGNILDEYVSIINSPTDDKPFNKTYTVAYLGNVIEGRKIKYLNLEMKDLKKMVIQQLDNDEVVWFGSDVQYYGDRVEGIWADDRFDYEKVLGFGLNLEKSSMLDFGHSQMNHAMVITGYAMKEGKPTKYKIENSWGDKTGKKGYYLASDSWFEKFVYQAVINKKYLSEEQKKIWKEEPIVLKPWDPMGSLAK